MSPHRAAGHRVAALAAPGYALALTLLVTGPLWRPGYLLLRDAVATPRSYLTDAALGLGPAAPRAVPQDFLVAVASRVLDGGVVVTALLVAGVWLAGAGAARLVHQVLPQTGLGGQCVAVTVAIWNPYVAERLLQGHWSLLVGYGALGWVAAAAVRARTDPTAGATTLAALMFWVVVAGLTPTGVILAALVAVVIAVGSGPPGPRWPTLCAGLGAALAAAGPWLAAVVVNPEPLAPVGSAAPGVAAFAARAEPGLGTLGAVAGLGGIWNGEAVPTSRTTAVAVLATAVLLAVVAAGIPTVARHPAARWLLVVAAVAVAAPAAAATGAGQAVLTAAIDAAPGLGVLRDGQKWVALALPAYTLAAAAAVPVLARWLRPALAAAVCCAALLAVLPDLAWGVGGAVRAVHYPPGWAAVAAAVNADPRPVAVLPAGSMRRFGWAGPAPVLDPLPRWVRAEVLAPGDLVISGRVVPGEGVHNHAVQQVLLDGADPAALAAAGVGWVVIDDGGAHVDPDVAATLQQLPLQYGDADLAAYRVGGQAPGASAGARRIVIGAHLLWLAVGAGAAAVALTARRRGAPSTTEGAGQVL